MALEIIYSPQFLDNLEAILQYFEEHNGSNTYSKNLLFEIEKQIDLLASMPEIGRQSDFPSVRFLFVKNYGIEYQIRENSIFVVDIFSCKTNPENVRFEKK